MTPAELSLIGSGLTALVTVVALITTQRSTRRTLDHQPALEAVASSAMLASASPRTKQTIWALRGRGTEVRYAVPKTKTLDQ